jgi:hypothetical protein
MTSNQNLGFVFIALALIFLFLTRRDLSKSRGGRTPARKTWLRIAFIFSGVGIFLYAMRLLSP